MVDLFTSLSGLPVMKEVTPDAINGLIDDAILYLYGVHRWPFMKQVNVDLAWTANAVTKSFDGVSRITSVRYPDTSTELRPLDQKADVDFARYKYNHSSNSRVSVWRDAGKDGAKAILELFAVPTSNVTLTCDMFPIPAAADVGQLPGHFRRLIRACVLSEVASSGISVVNVDYMVRDAIARAEDESGGTLEYAGRDELQESRLSDINNPS